jgi:hypothetical protein
MTGNLMQDWPVYVLGGLVVFFFVFMIIKSNLGEKDKGNASSSDKVKK